MDPISIPVKIIAKQSFQKPVFQTRGHKKHHDGADVKEMKYPRPLSENKKREVFTSSRF